MFASLDEILTYRHPAVVRRFQREYPQDAARAEMLFTELLRFFWGTLHQAEARRQRPSEAALDFVFIMDEEMLAMDRMWHIFLLYTQDYADFCHRYFGQYLHHLPDIVPTFGPEYDAEANLTKFLSYVYDLFGAEVVRRWFPV